LPADGQLERDRLAHVDPVAVNFSAQSEMATAEVSNLGGWPAVGRGRTSMVKGSVFEAARCRRVAPKKFDTRDLGFERADGQAAGMKREERLLQSAGRQIVASS